MRCSDIGNSFFCNHEHLFYGKPSVLHLYKKANKPVKKLEHLSEQQLLALYYSRQDCIYLGAALERYTAMLYGVALKYLKQEQSAMDAVQTVNMKALEKLPASVENFGGWLYQVMKNECFSLLRNTKDHYAELGEVAHEHTQDADWHWNIVHKEQQLKAAVLELKPDQRVSIELFFFQQKSYQEIMELRGWTHNETKSHLQNAKRNLKIMLEKRTQS